MEYFTSKQSYCTVALSFQAHATCLPYAIFCFSRVCMRVLASCHRTWFLCKFMYGKVPRPYLRYCATEMFITLWVCPILITSITIYTIHWHWDLHSNVCVLKGHAESHCYGETSCIILHWYIDICLGWFLTVRRVPYLWTGKVSGALLESLVHNEQKPVGENNFCYSWPPVTALIKVSTC